MEDKFYTIQETETLRALLQKIDDQRRQVNSLKPGHPELWSAIEEKLRADWTYDSNAIEGSTLTRGETLFFLREGLTVEGKPFKDFLDARNHAETIDLILGAVAHYNGSSALLVMLLDEAILIFL